MHERIFAPDRSFIVYPGADHYPVADGISVIGLRTMTELLLDWHPGSQAGIMEDESEIETFIAH